MHKAIAILVIFFAFYSANSQAPTFQWAKGFGGISGDAGIATVADVSGNVYVAGIIRGTVDMDPGVAVYNLTSAGSGDMFVSKFDGAGIFLWAQRIGGTQSDVVRAMSIDNSGNLYLTGEFNSTVDFDPGTGISNLTCNTNGSFEAFLLKLDPGGNYVWAKKLTDTEFGSSGRTLSIALSGNIYIAGSFSGTGDFDPGPSVFTMTTGTNFNIHDIFISKFDNNGNFFWAKQFSGADDIGCNSLVLDQAENIYMTGPFQGTCDFDPNASTYNLTSNTSNGPGWFDAYIEKMDANGNFVFAKQISGGSEEIGYDIVIDPLGAIFVTGEFYGIADFDPGPGAYQLDAGLTEDAFVLKLDDIGNFVWACQFTGTATPNSMAAGFSIDLDDQRNIYIQGGFKGGVDFDPGPLSYILSITGEEAVFIAKLSPNGNFIFAIQIGGDDYIASSSMIVDQQKNIIVTGSWVGTTDFDPSPAVFNLTSIGSSPTDAFVLKLNQSCILTSTSIINATACNTYILNGQTYTSSGTYNQTLINAEGCDSTITINLTLNGSNATSNATACESFSWQGQTYTSSGTYQVTYTDVNGCDSILNLILLITSNVTTDITVSICEGQSYAGHTSTGTYTDTYVAVNGCDSIRTLNLIVKIKSLSTVNAAICEGQSYAGHTSTGTYTDTYVAANGCDSIRTLNLIVKLKSLSTVDVVICEGQSYEGYTDPGSYTDTYVAANGCDSLRTLNLFIIPRKYTPVNVAICQGQSYLAGGQQQSTSGAFNDTLQTSLGCDSIIITTLTVNPNPTPNLGQDKDLCLGKTITFDPGSFTSYLWQDMSSTPTFTTNAIGLYWVTVRDNNNCFATDSVKINVIHPLPTNFLRKTDSICLNQNLILRPTSGYVNYSWSNGAFLDSISIHSPGQYWLTVKDVNGCVGSDTTLVFPKNCLIGVFIPSAFSPNNDRNNDIFKATVFGKVASFKLVIYDRSGQVIFSTNNYRLGWDGSFRGKLYPTATFIWQCSYQFDGKQLEYQSGSVVLLR